jgi:hypothetical protein
VGPVDYIVPDNFADTCVTLVSEGPQQLWVRNLGGCSAPAGT